MLLSSETFSSLLKICEEAFFPLLSLLLLYVQIILYDTKIDVQFKENLTGELRLLLYLIGKLYAKEAGLSATDDAGNKELIDELGIPEGSLLPWLKNLREKKKIKQVKRGRYAHHSISLGVVEKTLKGIEKKLRKNI